MYAYWNGMSSPFAALDAARRHFLNDVVLFDPSRTSGVSDVVDTGDAYVLTLEVPGLTANDIELNVTEQAFSLKAHQKLEVPEGYTLRRGERRHTEVTRTGRFPAHVDTENVRAALELGVLRITFPKAPEVRPRRVEIRASGH